MNIDTDPSVDDDVDATSGEDSGDTGSHEDSQDASSAEVGTTDQADSADEADSQDDGDGSTDKPNTTLQTAENKAESTPAPARDWEAELAAERKRVQDQRQGYTRLASEHDRLKKTYEGIDPAAVQQWKQDQELARNKNLAVWDKRNPSHVQFKSTLSRWKEYQADHAAAKTPEERALIEQMGQRKFNAADVEQIRNYQQHEAQFREQLAMDPRGTFADIAREVAAEVFGERQQHAQVQQQVEGWMTDAANAPLVEKYKPAMVDMLSRGWPWEAVQLFVQKQSQLDGLQSRVGPAEKASASARAKENALKQKATTTRDAGVKPIAKTDFWKEGEKFAKQHGLPSNHPRVLRFIDESVKAAGL
jgi:hypothetical protein